MGSPELYIQPILAESLQELDAAMSVMPGVAESMQTMTNQLNQTTRIMMNLLENQGLEQHQAPYTGASFSALTLAKATNPFRYAGGDVTSLFCYSKNAVTAATDEYITFNTDNGRAAVQYYCEPMGILLDNVVKIEFPFELGSGYSLYGTDEANIAYMDGTNEAITPVYSDGKVTLTTSGTNLDKKMRMPSFKLGVTGSSGSDTKVGAPIVTLADDTTVTLPIRYWKEIGFNSVNALTHVAKTQSTVTCQLADTPYPQTVFLTIPDEANVSKWSTAVLNGNIEGLTLAIADNTSHDILIALNAATSDISELQQFTNLALRVDFTKLSALSTLTGFTLRYF